MDVWFWIEPEPPPRGTNANRRCGRFVHCSPARKQLDEEVDTPVRRSGAFYRSIAQLVVENLVHDRTAGDTYPADPLPLNVSVLRGLIRAGLTVKGIYDSIPRKV